MSHHIFAEGATLDATDGTIIVDGVELPWHVRSVDVEAGGAECPLHVLTLEIYVDGLIQLQTAQGPQVYDVVLGDVAAAARRQVREAFAQAFPWLQLPPAVEA